MKSSAAGGFRLARIWTLVAMSLVFLVNLLIMWNTETVPAVQAALPDADAQAFVVLAGLLVVAGLTREANARMTDRKWPFLRQLAGGRR